MTGFNTKLKDSKKMPRIKVMNAIGATPESTWNEFSAKLRNAVGPMTGHRPTDKLPLEQILPALKIALGLRKPVTFAEILGRAHVPQK